MTSLNNLDTWELVRLPPGRKVVKTRWVFDVKRNGEGAVVRYKARLVAKGFTQVEGIDFQEVYSPVSRYATIRLVLAVSVTLTHIRWVLDVKNAFVNATLTETIYVSQPDGFVKLGKEDWVYVLRKALYGLRQASREWHLTLHKFLSAYGFEQSKADPTLYVWAENGSFVMIVVYVDDILMSSNSNKSINCLINYFKGSFEVRVESNVQTFLGFSVQDCGKSIELYNASMITRMLKAYRMQDCKPVETPLFQGLDLANDKSKSLTGVTPY